MATHLMLQEVEPTKRRQLLDELTGPLRATGAPTVDTPPSWWHGDDEAYESSMAAVAQLPGRRRR